MSIEISIVNRSLLKKPLDLGVFCSEGLAFGRYDGTRLVRGELGEGAVTLYHPDHIARGFTVTWSEGERQRVDLRLPSPTCREEIMDFYGAVGRIVRFWGRCAITQDGLPVTLPDLEGLRDEMVRFNLDTLRSFCRDREKGSPTLFCAYWPLELPPAEMDRFSRAESLDEFRDYLHERQDRDVYYARPEFYKSDNGRFGSYVYSENVEGIFPIKPYVPFGVTDGKTGEPLRVNRWFVTLFSTTLDTVLGHIPYVLLWDLAAEYADYDANHRIVYGVSLERMEAMAERHGVVP